MAANRVWSALFHFVDGGLLEIQPQRFLLEQDIVDIWAISYQMWPKLYILYAALFAAVNPCTSVPYHGGWARTYDLLEIKNAVETSVKLLEPTGIMHPGANSESK